MAADLTIGLLTGDDPAGLVRSAACVFNQSWTGSVAVAAITTGATSGETERVIRGLEARYEGLSVLPGSFRSGARARNEVLRSNDSKFLAWMGAGQVWHPHRLDRLFQALAATPGSRFVLPRFPGCLEEGLTGVLGETQSWRLLGELDERLSCLADEEFLLRLLLSDFPSTVIDRGGLHTVATFPDCRWQQLAADTATIWKKHGNSIGGKFGRSPTAEFRRWQLLRLVSAARRAGNALHVARFRLMAWHLGPAATARGQTSSDQPRGAARAMVERCSRLVARALTACRLDPDSRWIVSMATLLESPVSAPYLGLVPPIAELTAAPPVTSFTSEETELSNADRRALLVAVAAVVAGQGARAIEVLEARVDKGRKTVHPRVFDRLATLHLAARRIDNAEEVLAKGLQWHPDSGRLRLALAEAFAGGAKWHEAVEQWERAADDLRESARVWTCIGVARAFRHVGRAREAHALAERAAGRHPDNAELSEEIALCRPFLVDWSQSLIGVDVEGSAPHACTGSVESMGFLHGGTAPVVGRVTPLEVAAEVSLRVNGYAVASTTAASAPPDMRGVFAINCSALLEYLGDGDVIELSCNRGSVSMPGLGTTAMVHCGLPSRFEILIDRLYTGRVFTKDGRLRPGHTESSKQYTLDFFARVASLLETSTGQRVYPFYGNLLGAVRDGDFIAHDVDGFDLLYLCRGSGPDEVKGEIDSVRNALLREGYHIGIKPWSLMIRERPGDTAFLDLNYGWFTASDEFNVSYGWRCLPVSGRNLFLARRVCTLSGRPVPIPGNAEDVLEQLYGTGWSQTDQGFLMRDRLIRDDAYRLTSDDQDSLRVPNSSAQSRS